MTRYRRGNLMLELFHNHLQKIIIFQTIFEPNRLQSTRTQPGKEASTALFILGHRTGRFEELQECSRIY